MAAVVKLIEDGAGSSFSKSWQRRRQARSDPREIPAAVHLHVKQPSFLYLLLSLHQYIFGDVQTRRMDVSTLLARAASSTSVAASTGHNQHISRCCCCRGAGSRRLPTGLELDFDPR